MTGQPGCTKVTYTDPSEAVKWLWEFVDGAKTAGELYGRTLVVFAGQHYAHQIALPTSRRRPSVLPASRKDMARKAFEKIAKPALPASHGQLARAIEREARDYHRRQTELEQRTRPEADPSADAVNVKSEDLDDNAREDVDGESRDRQPEAA